MIVKWVKNADTSDHTWEGQLVAAGAYYQIQATEELRFAASSQLLTDIANGIAVMARDDTGNTNITDVNEAIDFLKDTGMQTVRNIVTTDDTTRSDWGHNFTAPANATTTENITLPYAAQLRGGEFSVENREFGDYIELDITLISDGTPVKSYIQKYQVFKLVDLQQLKDESISDPLDDSILQITIKYVAVNAGTTRNFAINFFSYVGS